MEIINEADVIQSKTLRELTKEPLFPDDPPQVKAAKFLKFWHENGRNYTTTANYFGIHRLTTKKIIDEIMTTTIYTQFLNEIKDSIDGIFSDSFKVQLFDRLQEELNAQKRLADQARKEIKEANNLEDDKDKSKAKEYWQGQYRFHIQQYHKLLDIGIKENAKWAIKGEQASKPDRPTVTDKTQRTSLEKELLEDRSIQ